MNRRIASYLFQPRALILGIAAWYFAVILADWMREPFLSLHKEMYLAGMLFISAVGLALNKSWSNLLAAVLCGQVPGALFYEFWMFAQHAEIPLLSSQHLYMWLENLAGIEAEPFLWCVLSFSMLALAVPSLCRAQTVGRLS